MNSTSLAGKKVVVIGGTAGIGLAAAHAAAQLGAQVWAAGRTEANIEKARQTDRDKIEFARVDTHDVSALTALFEQAGSIDHLVSAAIGGERTLKPFLDQTEPQFRAAFDKLWGYAKVVRTAAPFMAKNSSITLVSGSPARKIRLAQSALSCVGASVENLVRCLAVELAPIRVNVVSPGTVSTNMFDWMGADRESKLQAMTASHLIKRAGTPDEVAAGILFVMQNSFVTGTTVDVDGGRILA
jgi:NAD(P)-dependent dehydrogenase (short-subunit alcohol dehydrogenase family)